MQRASTTTNTDFGRTTNNDKLLTYIRDTENTVQYSPENYTGNKFLGQINKVMLMHSMLFHEQREKYTNQYTAELKAEAELESVPICFG